MALQNTAPGNRGRFLWAGLSWRTQSRRYRFSRRSTAKAEFDPKRDHARTVECAMKMSWKAVLTALLVAGGATTMSACASAQGYGYNNGYYGNGYTTMAMPIPAPMGRITAMAICPMMASDFPMTVAAIAMPMAARTITGTCRSITVRSITAMNGSTVRSITATGSAAGNIGSVAVGASTNGAAPVPIGGIRAAMVRR